MTTPKAVKRREQWIIRLLSAAIVLMVFAILGQGWINHNLREQQDNQHAAQLHACQQGNLRLRRTINQRIVAPIRAVLSGSGQPEKAKLFHTVPYAICANLYPSSGSPHGPFFRDAPLPPLLKADVKAGIVPSSIADISEVSGASGNGGSSGGGGDGGGSSTPVTPTAPSQPGTAPSSPPAPVSTPLPTPAPHCTLGLFGNCILSL